MGYFALLVAVVLALFAGSRVLKKKMQAEKEAVYEVISGSKEPLKAHQIADSLGVLDAWVYRYADELVKEKRIGVMITQDFVQGRRIRIVQYHAIAK